MIGYRRPRRASTKALAIIGVVVLAIWFAWAYRDAIGGLF